MSATAEESELRHGVAPEPEPELLEPEPKPVAQPVPETEPVESESVPQRKLEPPVATNADPDPEEL